MKQIITSPHAPAPIGPYNQAVKFGNMLFISGQIAIDPPSGELIMSSIQEESEQVMKNLKTILSEAGMHFSDVVKTSIFLKDMNQFAEVNAVYGAYFDPATAPARETVEVGNLPKFVNVEISMIAMT
ncbi:MAG: RidA family protein [Flavobacteriaceae bacterium]|nr:RidA family protein [Flavobacteriaceae bacterium]